MSGLLPNGCLPGQITTALAGAINQIYPTFTDVINAGPEVLANDGFDAVKNSPVALYLRATRNLTTTASVVRMSRSGGGLESDKDMDTCPSEGSLYQDRPFRGCSPSGRDRGAHAPHIQDVTCALCVSHHTCTIMLLSPIFQTPDLQSNTPLRP